MYVHLYERQPDSYMYPISTEKNGSGWNVYQLLTSHPHTLLPPLHAHLLLCLLPLSPLLLILFKDSYLQLLTLSYIISASLKRYLYTSQMSSRVYIYCSFIPFLPCLSHSQDAERHQLYCHEIIELNEDISILLIIPPSDQVYTYTFQNYHF